jgi:hypothetical protein
MTHMPGYENVQQVLDVLRNIHEQMAELYCRLRHGASDARAAMLLELLENREKRSVESLGEYEEYAPKSILSTWIQVPYSKDPEEFLNRLESEVPLDLSVSEIYQLGLKVDDFIGDLLEHLQENSDIDEVKRVFENLREGERQESIILSKAVNSFREI